MRKASRRASTRVPANASTTPRRAPPTERTRLSVSIWRIRRLRPAPSAARMAISCWRVVARASSRLESLAQTMSITAATAQRRARPGRAGMGRSRAHRDAGR